MTERPKRSGIMLCYPFERERLEGDSRKAWNSWPVITQPKLDGERCRALFDADGKVLLLSSTEEPIVSVPHIYEQLEATGLRSVELDGELYTHGMSFEEIHSRVSRRTNLHPGYRDIEYHIFDLVASETCVERQIRLTSDITIHIAGSGYLHLVEADLAIDFDAIMERYDSYCEDNFEGIIIRRCDAPYIRQRSTAIMKFKPKKSDVYRIVGTKEEKDKYGVPKGRLGALICSGDDGAEFDVGSGLTDQQREEFWNLREILPGNLVMVKYQALNPATHNPRFPVFVEILTKMAE